MNSGSTASINREWNACDVRTRRATIPCSAAILEPTDAFFGSRDNAVAGIVYRGEIDVWRKIFSDRVRDSAPPPP